jgi:hypothetical protein
MKRKCQPGEATKRKRQKTSVDIKFKFDDGDFSMPLEKVATELHCQNAKMLTSDSPELRAAGEKWFKQLGKEAVGMVASRLSSSANNQRRAEVADDRVLAAFDAWNKRRRRPSDLSDQVTIYLKTSRVSKRDKARLRALLKAGRIK